MQTHRLNRNGRRSWHPELYKLHISNHIRFSGQQDIHPLQSHHTMQSSTDRHSLVCNQVKRCVLGHFIPPLFPPPPSLCSAPSLSSKSRLASAVTSAPVHLFSLISSLPESSFSLFTPLISTFPALSLAPPLLLSTPALLLYSSGLACPHLRWLFYLPLKWKSKKEAVSGINKQIKYKK